MLFYLYILECQNGSFYTGYTRDLERRFKEHQAGTKKCKYTRSFPPKNIAAAWEADKTLGEVLALELAIKRLSRSQKKILITQTDTFASTHDLIVVSLENK